MSLTDDLKIKLDAAARKASANAHSPYSGLNVGAAVLSDDQQIFSGCNVESASYGLTCCAERTALFSAIAAGKRAGEMQAMVIYVPGERAFSACGACRQVISELMPADAPVLSICDGEDRIDWTVAECLPRAFKF